MTKLNVNYITESGCSIYGTIAVSKDYTMNEVVRKMRNFGAIKFRLLDTMKVFANIK